MGRRKGNSQGGGSGHSEVAEQAERLRSVCGAELKGISAAKVQAALAEADGDLQEAIRMLLGSSGRPNESELLDQALAKLARAGAGGAAAQAASSGKRGRRDGGRRRSDNGGRGGKDSHAAGAGDSNNASASSEEETADSNSNNGSSGTAEPKKHLRTSEDVFHRLKWDPDYDNGDFIVGYMDRFDGMKESEFALWVERDVTAETFIPWHRVYYFQRKSDGVRVWDRESRTDLVFEGAAEVDSDAGVAPDATGASAVAASPSPKEEAVGAGEGEVSSGASANGESSRAGALAPSDANDDDQVAHEERDQRAGATAATCASQRKVVTSAVVVSPPEEMWDVINEIRQKHDRAYPRWMPHISMAYPFVPEEEFETARAALEDELQNSTPFTVTLADFGFFEHGKGGTVWLDPRVQEGVTGRDLHDLQAALARAVPHCNNVAEHAGGFHPHLSVAQAPKAQLGDQANKFQKGWAALKFEVKEVCMIARGKTGSEEDEFRVVHRVPLGGSADRQAFSKAEAAVAAASGSSSAGGNAAPAGSRSGGGNRGRGGRGGRGGNHQRGGGASEPQRWWCRPWRPAAAGNGTATGI